MTTFPQLQLAKKSLATEIVKGNRDHFSFGSVAASTRFLADALEDYLKTDPNYSWGAGPELADLFRGHKPRLDGTGTGEGDTIANHYFDEYGWRQSENSASDMVKYLRSRADHMDERQAGWEKKRAIGEL